MLYCFGLFICYVVFSEPKERAKEPEKGKSSLTGPNQETSIANHENASHDDIQRSCQQLIDDINAKRKRDTDLLNGTSGVCFSNAFNTCNNLFTFEQRNYTREPVSILILFHFFVLLIVSLRSYIYETLDGIF